MAVSNMKATFQCDVQKAWDVITSLTDYSWRSDLSKIEIISDTQFIEVSKDGYRTTFTITARERCRYLEFDMENENMSGHWTGLFHEENGIAAIDFTEDVVAKKLLMKPFVGIYLKKQQASYVSDLRKVLEAEL